jgi:hypothetical protein
VICWVPGQVQVKDGNGAGVVPVLTTVTSSTKPLPQSP